MQRIALPLAVLVFACGGTVVEPGDTSASASGTGGAGGTSASSSAAIGGNGGGFDPATSSASSGQGGGFASCPDTFIAIEGDGGPLQLTSGCGWGSSETAGPVGYLFSGGQAVGNLVVEGCAANPDTDPLLRLGATFESVPETALGQAYYVDASGTERDSGPKGLSMTLTTFEKVGTVIEGSFTATLEPGGMNELLLSGSFRVCRVEDQNLP
jgi:hypothetical protein